MILADNEDGKSARSKATNKYERQIKQGLQADDKFAFPNYFVSMKSRSKITQAEEKEANKVLLNDKAKSSQSTN